MFKINTKGDTIVEVLIAITVLAFALGTGYATVSRSNLSIQSNKERYQAQLVASQQIEALRAYISAPNSRAGFSADTCVKEGLIKTGADQCKFAELNADSSAAGATYTVATSPVSPSCIASSTYCTYKIDVTWESLKGGTERATLYYGL
jgi:Tfp pilus assembly protein PilV